MLILTEPLLQALADAKVPIINLHPALPGEYNGVSHPRHETLNSCSPPRTVG